METSTVRNTSRRTWENKRGQELRPSDPIFAATQGDLHLRHLDSCLVDLRPHTQAQANKLQAVFVQEARCSILLIGTIEGSVMLRDCHDILIVGQCRQVRLCPFPALGRDADAAHELMRNFSLFFHYHSTGCTILRGRYACSLVPRPLRSKAAASCKSVHAHPRDWSTAYTRTGYPSTGQSMYKISTMYRISHCLPIGANAQMVHPFSRLP